MRNKFPLLLLLFPLLMGCSGSSSSSSESLEPSSSESIQSFIHQLTVTDIFEDISIIYKTDCNITSFKFVIGEEEVSNIDIYRGQFDLLELTLRISYSDETSKDVVLKMNELSREMRDIINTEGTHVFEFLFRGTTKTLTMVVHPSTQKFLVKYLNYDGTEYQTFIVEPGEVIIDEDIPILPNRMEDTRFVYLRDKWSVDLKGVDINQDYIIYPEYKLLYIRYNAVKTEPLAISSIPESVKPWEYRLLYKKGTSPESDNYLFFHMARLTRVPILGYEATEGNVHHHADITDSQILTQSFYIDNDSASKQAALQNIWDKGKAYTALPISGFYNDEPGGTGEASGYLNNGNFNLILADSKDIGTILNGNTSTKFKNDDKDYSIYTSYMDSVYQYYYQYKEDHGTPYEAEARIYGNSNLGYYRIALEGDIDVILELDVCKAGTGGLSLLARPNVYMVVDTSTIEAVIDYEESPKGEETLPRFDSAGYSLSFTNQDIFYYSYCALYGEYELS